MTRYVCKTFTRRFDSDRRLHNLNKFNSLQALPFVAHSSSVSLSGHQRANSASRRTQTILEMLVNAGEIAPAGMIELLPER